MTARSLALAKLYEAEQSRLRALVRRLVGNPTTAEDVVQQAFANLLARSEQGLVTNPAYVTQIVRNLAFNHLRDARRRARIEIPDAGLEAIPDPQPSPELVALYRSELQRLLLAIAELPERRRMAFILSRIEGLRYDEIAERMGVSRNTVISQVVAAMADLDRKLS
ncbi:MAG: RNA polymerase sigma factor [Hyphomicrobiaceae bacterium]